MSNSIAPGSSADVNVRVTALTTNPNVPAQYKTIILKKNLVNGVNTLTQEMMQETNTIYIVKYDFEIGEIYRYSDAIKTSDPSIIINNITYNYISVNLSAGDCFVLEERTHAVLLNDSKTSCIEDYCVIAQNNMTVYLASCAGFTVPAVYSIKKYITIPNNCILKFEGGTINNGVLVGSNTKISTALTTVFGNQLDVTGTWDCDSVFPQWFGAKGDGTTNDTDALVKWADFPCKNKIVPQGIYNTYEVASFGLNGSTIVGYGATFKYVRLDIEATHRSMSNHAVLCNTPSLFLNKTDQSWGNITIYGLTIDGNKDNFIYSSDPTGATGLIFAFGINIYLLKNLKLIDVKVLNTFMTGVMLKGVDNVYADRCEIKHIGECDNYTPYGSVLFWEGIMSNHVVDIYGNNSTIVFDCNKAIVTNSYFEDIAGSYFSAFVKHFESGNNIIINNRGYGHELSTDIYEEIYIHDNKFYRINGCFATITIPIETSPNVRVLIKRNIIDGFGEASPRRNTPALLTNYIFYLNNVNISYTGNNRFSFVIEENTIKVNENRRLGYFPLSNVTVRNNELFFNYTSYEDMMRINKTNLVFESNNLYSKYLHICGMLGACENIVIDGNIFVDTDSVVSGSSFPYIIQLAYKANSLILKNNKAKGFYALIQAVGPTYDPRTYKIENNISDGDRFVYCISPANYANGDVTTICAKDNTLENGTDGIKIPLSGLEYTADSDVLSRSGTFGDRPIIEPVATNVGFKYFATDLGNDGTPIFYTGKPSSITPTRGLWVYPDGTPVN